MKILVTGAKGFIGKNLVCALYNKNYSDIFQADIDTEDSALEAYAKECDFVFHLAGVNRPKDEAEFISGNVDYTDKLLSYLKENKKKPPVLVSSSIQADLENPYGLSKKTAEERIFTFGEENESDVYVFRLPNVFGKWCNPNYNSVVATFCNNIANDIPIQINGEDTVVNIVYIDDVLNAFISALEKNIISDDKHFKVNEVYSLTLGELADKIKSFKESRDNISVPNMNDALTKKLYSTYLSYLPTDSFSYKLKTNIDDRGSFTEFVRTDGQGQFSVNIAKPGITKGNHWHDTKNEKFYVVSGEAVIKFRKINEEKIYEYYVNGDSQEVVDIPVGYTHNITNIGKNDLITVMWANESFDEDNPDTWYLEV